MLTTLLKQKKRMCLTAGRPDYFANKVVIINTDQGGVSEVLDMILQDQNLIF